MAEDPVVKILSVEEPDYDALAARYEDDPGGLLAILESGEPLVAARAVYIAGAIARRLAAHRVDVEVSGDTLEVVSEVVNEGSRHEDPTVRVAAAIAAAALPEERGAAITTKLLRDDDIGVQKSAIEGVPRTLTPEIVAALQELATNETGLSEFAQHLLDHHPHDEGAAPL